MFLSLCSISKSVALPSGFTAFKDKKIMSVFLSYSPSTLSSLTSLGSKATPSVVCLRVVVDKISSLTTTPVSDRPNLSNCFLISLANLLVLPSSIASAKLINLGSISSGGKTFSCLTVSSSTNLAITSSDKVPCSLRDAPNSSGVWSKASALLAISNSKLSFIR